jgi:hypothetical protein
MIGVLGQKGLVHFDGKGEGIAYKAGVRVAGEDLGGTRSAKGIGYGIDSHLVDGTGKEKGQEPPKKKNRFRFRHYFSSIVLCIGKEKRGQG